MLTLSFIFLSLHVCLNQAVTSPPRERAGAGLVSDRGRTHLALKKTFRAFSTSTQEVFGTKLRKPEDLEIAGATVLRTDKDERDVVLDHSDGDVMQVAVSRHFTAPADTAASHSNGPKPRRAPLMARPPSGHEVLRIYTDDMREELEKVVRKPHFDDLGDLVIPPVSIDAALSAGISGVPPPVALRPNANTTRTAMDANTVGRHVPPLYADTESVPIVGVVYPQAVHMFKDAADGALPLPLDLDNEFFINTPKATEHEFPPKGADGAPLSDALRATWGDMLSEDGSNSTNVIEAYNTLLNLNPEARAARAARIVPKQLHTTVEDGAELDSESLSSASSLPYPYPFPSFMYSAKPPPRLGVHEPADLALIGQASAVHVNPAQLHQRAGKKRQEIAAASLLEGSDMSPPSLVRRFVGNAEVLSRPPAYYSRPTSHSPNEQDSESIADANSVESRGSSGVVTMPSAISSAVVQRGSKMEARTATPDEDPEVMTAVIDEDPYNDAQMEKEMEEELREMLRGYSDNGVRDSSSSAHRARKPTGGQQGLPKIGPVSQNSYSTPILALASPNMTPDLHRSSSMPIGFKPGSGLNKVGALAKSNVGQTSRPSKALASAGSSSMSALPHVDDIRIDVAASGSSGKRWNKQT